MIKMGFNLVPLYKDTGIMIQTMVLSNLKVNVQ